MLTEQPIAYSLSRLKRRFQGRWSIGFVKAPIDVFLDSNVNHTVWLPPIEVSKFLADPFGVSKDGTTYILCEEYDKKNDKGRIVSISLSSDGSITQPEGVFNFPFHASYPYLFENGGKIYCVPETANAKEISLFQSDEFPSKWQKIFTFVKGFLGVDNTIFRYQGLWWLSSSLSGDDSSLYLWYSDELLGRWHPHSLNPVKVDIHSSRPAGTPFFFEGELYRPAQDCSRIYGGRIALNRVVQLTPSEFKEELFRFVQPNPSSPYGDGLHTISSAGDITLLDGYRASPVERVITSGSFGRDVVRRLGRHMPYDPLANVSRNE